MCNNLIFIPRPGILKTTSVTAKENFESKPPHTCDVLGTIVRVKVICAGCTFKGVLCLPVVYSKEKQTGGGSPDG